MPLSENWTFFSDNNKKFTVLLEAARLSKLFDEMSKSSSEKILELSIVKQIGSTGQIIEINSTKMLEYVYDYFKLWENNPSDAHYVEEKPIQTCEISHVLQLKDIKYIEDYLQKECECKGTESQIRSNKIKCLGNLLLQVDEFLNIPSLSNKIYAYIAVLIWNTSVVDFAEALKDQNFLNAQKKAIAEWEKDNPGKFAEFVHDNIESILDSS